MTTLMPGHAPLKYHPAADIFPLLSDSDLAELANDIALNGQRETVKLHHGMILDGRNRYRACVSKNLPVRCEVFDGTNEEAFDFVISKNVHRRHLTPSQRAHAMALYEKFRHGGNRRQRTDQDATLHLEGFAPSAPAVTPATRADLAERGSVSPRLIASAAVVRDQGTTELNDAVRDGTIAITTAEEIAALPAEEQQQVVRLTDDEILAKAKELRKAKGDVRRAERTEKLKAQAAASTDLPTGRKFPVIYFDPATKFAAGDSDRSTENHYLTMKEEDIAALPIAELATDDAVIFMWTTVPWLAKSLRLIEGWGFEYKSAAFWDKVDIGLGFWWRDQVEVLITATRGKMVAPENGSVLGPNLYRQRKGEHSAKPTYFRDRIGSVPEYASLPKVELFARVDGPMPEGWFAWGAEARVPEQQALGIDQTEAA